MPTHVHPAPHTPRPTQQEIRATVDHILATAPSRFRDWTLLQYAAAILIGACCFPLGMWVQSTRSKPGIVVDSQPTVDGIVLAEDEMEFIRGIRLTHNALIENKNSERMAEATREYLQLMDEERNSATRMVKRKHPFADE